MDGNFFEEGGTLSDGRTQVMYADKESVWSGDGIREMYRAPTASRLAEKVREEGGFGQESKG